MFDLIFILDDLMKSKDSLAVIHDSYVISQADCTEDYYILI